LHRDRKALWFRALTIVVCHQRPYPEGESNSSVETVTALTAKLECKKLNKSKYFQGLKSHILLKRSLLSQKVSASQASCFYIPARANFPCLQAFKDHKHLFYTEFFGTALEKNSKVSS